MLNAVGPLPAHAAWRDRLDAASWSQVRAGLDPQRFTVKTAAISRGIGASLHNRIVTVFVANAGGVESF
jgi:hypothetical protein